MFNSLWEWWIEGLLAPLPSGLRRWLRGDRRRVWASETAEGFELASLDGGAWKTIWKGPADRVAPARVRRRLNAADIVLRLPEHSALKRKLSLPRDVAPAAYVRRRLAELSPFPESETCFDVFTASGEPSPELVMARAPEVRERLDRLKGIGVRARGVGVEKLEHAPLNLLPADRAPPPRRDAAGVLLFAVGLAACAGAVAFPFLEQERALRDLTSRQERLERRLASVADSRERILGLRDRAAAIVEQETSRPDPVTLLAGVTDAVPDHSWVRQLVLSDGELTLQGESGDTADLIARLEASSVLKNVRYETAITRDASSGVDRFKLSADTDRGGS